MIQVQQKAIKSMPVNHLLFQTSNTLTKHSNLGCVLKQLFVRVFVVPSPVAGCLGIGWSLSPDA